MIVIMPHMVTVTNIISQYSENFSMVILISKEMKDHSLMWSS